VRRVRTERVTASTIAVVLMLSLACVVVMTSPPSAINAVSAPLPPALLPPLVIQHPPTTTTLALEPTTTSAKPRPIVKKTQPPPRRVGTPSTLPPQQDTSQAAPQVDAPALVLRMITAIHVQALPGHDALLTGESDVGLMSYGFMARSSAEGASWAGPCAANTAYDASFLDSQRGWLAENDRNAHWQPSVLHATTNGGNQWHEVSPDLPVSNVDHMFFADLSRGWVLGHSFDTWTGEVSPHVLLATADGGTSWRRDATPADDLVDAALADPDNGVVIGRQGDTQVALVTHDGGHTFTVHELPSLMTATAVAATSDGYVVVGTATDTASAAIVVSTDMGDNWTARDAPGRTAGTVATQGATVLAGLSGDEGPELWRSNDAGATWTAVAAPNVFTSLSTDESDVWAVTIGTSRLLHSRDGGITWVELPTYAQTRCTAYPR
jgi:hypothetical protein